MIKIHFHNILNYLLWEVYCFRFIIIIITISCHSLVCSSGIDLVLSNFFVSWKSDSQVGKFRGKLQFEKEFLCCSPSASPWPISISFALCGSQCNAGSSHVSLTFLLFISVYSNQKSLSRKCCDILPFFILPFASDDCNNKIFRRNIIILTYL